MRRKLAVASLLVLPLNCHALDRIFVDAGAIGGADTGDSWQDAYTDLEDALDDARDNLLNGVGSGPFTEIWIANGTYFPSEPFSPYPSVPVPTDPNDPEYDKLKTFLLVPQTLIYGGFTGTETLLSERVVSPYVRSSTVLSCDLDENDALVVFAQNPRELNGHSTVEDNCRHVLFADHDLPTGTTPADANTLLDGLTISGGNASLLFPLDLDPPQFEPANFEGVSGGGLYSSQDTAPTLRNMWFEYNYAFLEGGAINARGKMDLADSYFTFNHAAAGNGGAIMPGSHDLGNNVDGATIRRSKFIGNVGTSEGGAINVNDVSVSIDRCEFIDNFVFSSGGALSITNFGTATVTNSLFLNNRAGVTQSAVKTDEANQARSGMGLPPVTGFDGGAITLAQGSTGDFRNITVVGNSNLATNGFGGAIGLEENFFSNTLMITNSIFFDNDLANTDPERGRQIFCSTTANANSCTVDYTAMPDFNDADVVTGTAADLVIGAGMVSTEPDFVLYPVVTVGQEPDLHLSPTSDLIDIGNAYIGIELQKDIDGDDRVINGICSTIPSGGLPDLGSDEFVFPACWGATTQCLGDASIDGNINAQDAGIWLAANGSSFGDPNYNPCADFNRDGVVNGDDDEGIDDKDILMNGGLPRAAVGTCDCSAPWPPN